MITEPKVTYRGWAGHFILGHKCQFHLNTLIEYKRIKIVVSTVGRLPHTPCLGIPRRDWEEVGCSRHYETMAFHASLDGKFWDADVSRQVDFDAPWSWPKIEDEDKANDGHYAVVKEICDGLKRGKTYGRRDGDK
jgi:hypothetical protein